MRLIARTTVQHLVWEIYATFLVATLRAPQQIVRIVRTITAMAAALVC